MYVLVTIATIGQNHLTALGPCDNRNSLITTVLFIIMIVPCMHEIPQNTIKYPSLCCSLYAIQCLVARYAVCYHYVKIPTLVTNYSTKGNIFTSRY